MIKFFRHIRHSLINQSQMGKYFKYAIGEILLVVVGILIALWINNLNTERQLQKEKSTLLVSLEQELNENEIEFKNRVKLLTKANLNLIKVLNFSANENNTIDLDSLKHYVKEAITVPAIDLNNSILNSTKSSGKFNLLSQDIVSSFTEYETAINNYLEFISETRQVFNDEWSDLTISFNALNELHNLTYPNAHLISHPDLNLTNQELTEYLRHPKTYKTLHRYYVKFTIENLWLEHCINKIKTSLATITEE